MVVTYACNDAVDKDSYAKQDLSPAYIKSAEALRSKMALPPYCGPWGYGSSENWKRPTYDEATKKLIDIIAIATGQS